MRIEKIPYTFSDYNFFVKFGNEEIRVASLASQLVGTDKMFLYMHFPTDECSKTVLDLKYHTYNEVFEQAKKIVCKKMYRYSQNILESITTN